jgi:DNA (cytosine-5)-methyltransferase 1
MPDPLRLGSLFRGIGGIDKGFEDAGIEPHWSVEIDPSCNAVARRHWPQVPVVKDVREAGKRNLAPVDVIAFGSPCQDLSLAGKRKGLEGERSGLFFEAGRVIRELRPQLAVWENVPGAFSSYTPAEQPPGEMAAGSEWEVEEESDFAAVLAEMEKCGALDVGWRVLDSQWFGVAQRRRRIILVADFAARRAEKILALSESLRGHPAPRREPGQAVAGPLESRPGGGGFPGTDAAASGFLVSDVGPTLKGGNGPSGRCELSDGNGDGLIVQGVREPAERARHDAVAMAVRIAQTGANGHGVSEDVSHTLDAANGQAVAFQPRFARNGRGAPSDVAYPLTAEAGTTGKGDSGNAVLVLAWGVRRLTPTECERLQGFPDGWTAWGINEAGERIEISDSARYRMLGNAVTRTVASWLGKRIVAVLRETR